MMGPHDIYPFPSKWRGYTLSGVPALHLLNCYEDGCYKGTAEYAGRVFDLNEIHDYVKRNYDELRRKADLPVYVPGRVEDSYFD